MFYNKQRITIVIGYVWFLFFFDIIILPNYGQPTIFFYLFKKKLFSTWRVHWNSETYPILKYKMKRQDST